MLFVRAARAEQEASRCREAGRGVLAVACQPCYHH